MIILSGKNISITPAITVRKPNRHQRCIAFNAALSSEVKLNEFGHIIIDLDRKKKTITFTPRKTAVGNKTHKLLSDGGHGKLGRAVFLPSSAITEETIKSKRYDVQINGDKFYIKF